jgi:hypothetical protein
MRVGSLRRALVVLGAAGLAVAMLPAGSAGADPARGGHHSIGAKCLVGTWVANHGRTTTRFNGLNVVMHAGGGDVAHIAASGVSHDNWAKSLPLVGNYRGHPLTEHIRGVNKQRLHAAKVGHHLELTVTELGWSPDSTNRYLYRGHHRPGYLNQVGVHTYRFTCTATTLTFKGPKGHVIGTETRTSRKP